MSINSIEWTNKVALLEHELNSKTLEIQTHQQTLEMKNQDLNKIKTDFRYTQPSMYICHVKTGPSGIKMVIFWKKIWSGFQMATYLFLPFENRTGLFSSASLDHFAMNKIFFMTLFFIKRSKLAIQNLDKKVRLSNGPIFECLGPA
jgi:hypothetical protein